MGATIAVKNKKIREEALRDQLRQKGLHTQVLVIAEKLENSYLELDSTHINALKASADLKMKLINKYMPDLKAEFSDYNYERGTIGMARTANPDSANSQFFICFDDCSFLNGQYTVWGQVVEGMKYVDMIEKGEPPASPDKIIKASIAADAP